jgi:DNA-binding winged helix-turn-helix (wHTH) protein/TolB-like protein/Tfp pilus assembly protein PilF
MGSGNSEKDPTELNTSSYYEFGPFRLEPSEHRLMRGGQQVSLAPKTFELLVRLVENRGKLVLKEQIMQAVWPGSFVEDANLTVSISALRKVLGKQDGVPPYIETVPKKGYRFTALVREGTLGEPPAASPETWTLEPYGIYPAELKLIEPKQRKRRWIVISVLVVLCVLAIAGYFVWHERANPAHALLVDRSLGILPLRNLTPSPDYDFLGFSLADAVITKLGAIDSLTVRPSSAIEKYKGQTIDLSRVAAELKVDTLLTGTFIRDGDQLRITCQLIDVRNNKILAMDTIDLKYDKLLAVQDKVARQIIKRLGLKLSPSEAERFNLDEPTDPLSYEYYLRGVDLMGSHDFPLAVKMLERSASIDPEHALTWAYLGQSYTSAAAFQFGGRETYRKAQAAYERALALRPKQLEASVFLANLLIDTGKVEQAVPILREATKNNPKDAGVHWELGYAYRFAGVLAESAAECERALQMDPSVKSNGSVLNTYLYLGEYDKFLESLPDANNSAFLLFYRGFGEYYKYEWDRAAKDFDLAYQLDPTLYTQIGTAFSDSIEGRYSGALEILRHVESKIRERGVGDAEATYKIAQGYAVSGDRASAIRMLRYSIQNGFFSYPYFLADPLLKNIRSEPEFPQLMEIARRRHEAFKRRFF